MQSEAHLYFAPVAPRELTPLERAVVTRILSAAPQFAGEVPRLRVVGRCACGACPTVFFRKLTESGSERDVAHFVGREKGGGLTGAVLLASEGGLSQLEFYSVDGHDPWDIPEISTLEPTA